MKSRVQIAREVIAGMGDWGSGTTRIEKLKKAGYDPDQVQGDINTILCCRENIITNIKAMAHTIADNNNWWYIYWTEKYGHECAICHPHGGENHGWQCIGYAAACWHHGGLPSTCYCGTVSNEEWEYILNAKTDADALKKAQKCLGIKDIKVIRNKKGLSKSQAKPGDMAAIFHGSEFYHTFIVMSNSKIADATTQTPKANNIRADRSFSGRYVDDLKVIIRYTGKGLCSPPKRTVDQLAHEVIANLWGSGDSRVTALKEARHDYNAVQKRVNEILNSTPTPKSTPTPTTTTKTTKKKYTGEIPTLRLVKSNAQVKADAIAWAKWIAGDNRFHYGYGQHAHHNGCYFCGTQSMKKNHGIVDPEFTYCCNPFVGAAWAHGGCIPKAISMCQNYSSWDFNPGQGYDASSLFDKLGHPAKSKLKAGDVLCNGSHVALYIGNNKIAEASGGDDNKRNSSRWNDSIHITTLTDNRYKNFPRAYRFNGKVNADIIMCHGEVSDRVLQWQKFLDWYFDGAFCKECGAPDRYYGDNTLKWTKKFQAKEFGKKEADGTCGNKTFGRAKEIEK